MDGFELIIGLIIAFIAARWVRDDAEGRGLSTKSQFWWSACTFLFLIIALPLYLLSRPKK